MGNIPFPHESESEWVMSPTQPDGSSCGVMVVAHAYSYLKSQYTFQSSNVTKDDFAIMRLRVLWMIVTQPTVSVDTTEALKIASETDKALCSCFYT